MPTAAPAPSTVYPRVCGGTHTIITPFLRTAGLSPRVRGNPAADLKVSAAVGSIPACAGEPRRQRRNARRSSVYPRVCGGTAGSGGL